MAGKDTRPLDNLRDIQKTCVAGSLICCALIIAGSAVLSLADMSLVLGLAAGAFFVNVNIDILGKSIIIMSERGPIVVSVLLYILHILIYALGLLFSWHAGDRALPGFGIGVMTVIPSLLWYFFRNGRRKGHKK